jgi:hypothetical protein
VLWRFIAIVFIDGFLDALMMCGSLSGSRISQGFPKLRGVFQLFLGEFLMVRQPVWKLRYTRACLWSQVAWQCVAAGLQCE